MLTVILGTIECTLTVILGTTECTYVDCHSGLDRVYADYHSGDDRVYADWGRQSVRTLTVILETKGCSVRHLPPLPPPPPPHRRWDFCPCLYLSRVWGARDPENRFPSMRIKSNSSFLVLLQAWVRSGYSFLCSACCCQACCLYQVLVH